MGENMRRILVLAPPEDRVDRAVGLASDLAERADLEVFLVWVLEEGLHPHPRGAALDAERLRDLLVEAEVRELEQLATPLRDAGRLLDTSVCWGVPWEVVLELVERLEIDLVVKPARGLSHSGRVFFGVTALQLFRRCPCPVWVVGDDGRLPRRILAAVDPSGGSVRQAVGERVLQWASWIAGLSAAELHVASYWRAPAADLLKAVVPAGDLEPYVDEARENAREALDRLLEGIPGSPPADRVHLVEGDPRDLLPRFAEGGGFDLVVMGSQGRAGVAGELLGETAELVVRAVRSSVVTVSPRSRSIV